MPIFRCGRHSLRYEMDFYRSADRREPLPKGGGSFGSWATTTTQHERWGEAPVATLTPKRLRTGFDPLHPCECEERLGLYGLGSSRPNSTLTTEEISNNGIWPRRCHRVAVYRSRSRAVVVGRHLALTQAPMTSQVRLLSRGLPSKAQVVQSCENARDGSNLSASSGLTFGRALDALPRWPTPCGRGGGPVHESSTLTARDLAGALAVAGCSLTGRTPAAHPATGTSRRAIHERPGSRLPLCLR
jgi:hypothetical protein